ncbi:MAG: phosphoribosyltransferase, partial [Candidatus Paceibacterota bacterium]
MDYISFADMGRTVVSKLYKIPQDIDLIVGIPRSGLLAGNIIALSLNLPIIDIDGFIYNRRLRHGFTRKTKTYISLPHEAKHILIVDDTIDTGKTMDRVKMRLKNSLINQQISFCSVYAEQKSIKKIDIFLEKLS